ncbi:hypothetical protein [Endozoicomonas sp. SESOKO4]|uniref:hypothetical protein n=1 Tax=Endozoicomonas sp. SESOKO4 TaxID=2828745 RepID=UPI0021479AEF|nr:hypothetical protein [Endozoicomonas sp. SESOKO4]
MDFSSLKGAYDGFKHAKDIFQLLLEAKIDSEAKEKVNAAMRALTEAQDSLFNTQSVLFSLQDENKKLQEKIAEYNAWDEKFKAYELVETPGRAIVYQSQNSPKHYACPACMEEKRISILQDRKVASGVFDCPYKKCSATYGINEFPILKSSVTFQE